MLVLFGIVTWSQLECLHLRYITQTPQSLCSWARENWPALCRLHLNSCISHLCDVVALSHWNLPQLQCLQLSRANFEHGKAASHLITAYLPCLKELVLESSWLGNEGLVQVVKGNWWSLKILNLQNNRLDFHSLSCIASGRLARPTAAQPLPEQPGSYCVSGSWQSQQATTGLGTQCLCL
jgi:hypothetical protein